MSTNAAANGEDIFRESSWPMGGEPSPVEVRFPGPESGELAHMDASPLRSVECPLGGFFVREDYIRYYEYMEAAWRGKKSYITITGSPGIGKSIFFLYYFNRFRADHPEVTIVTAVFETMHRVSAVGSNSVLRECVVFEPGKAPRREPAIPSRKESWLHLYHGAPPLHPIEGRMVCFTNPDPVWKNQMSKFETHMTMTLPPWDLGELLEANEVLEIGLDVEVVEARFLFFGGAASHCLSLNADFVEREAERIRDRIARICSFAELSVLMREAMARSDDVAHRILSSVPVLGEWMDDIVLPVLAKQWFASPLISGMIDASITARNDAKVEARVWSITRVNRDLGAWMRPDPLPEVELATYRNLLHGL